MFRTELIIAPVAQQLPPSARVLTLGSCFAESIGARLAADKVNVLVNPFGTVFQPLAVGRLLRAALGEDVDWQQHLVEARGRWQSYDLHGSQGAASPVELLHDIQQAVQRTGEFLRGADAVLLTLGTAWAYRLRETGELVSNCHKMPAELFEKELLTPDEIINALAETHAYLRRINPKLRIILTVSPVRHIKDTLPLNAVSKSVLRVACHYLSELLPDVSYFPAYELLTDDLRDYRFYAADMLHPSEVAQDYIWEKFARTYFDAEFGRFRKEWAGLRQALGHRPLNAGAPEHRQFLESTRERLERLGRQRVNVAAELREVHERLATLPMPAVAIPAEPEPDDEERIDIGPDAEPVATAPPAPLEPGAAAPERAPRLSPEEFRAQRAGRNNRPERSRREAAPRLPLAAAETDETLPLAPAPTDENELADNLEFAADLVLALPGAADVEADPLKKKKRRSRGGAKRTARKNAAKLAAESTGVEAAEISVAENPSVAEPAPGAAPRNPQQDVRKSSVITKSVPVKRGGRGRGRSEETITQPDAAEAAPLVAALAGTTVLGLSAAEIVEQPAVATPQTADAPATEPTAPAVNQSSNRRNQGPKARPLFATPSSVPAADSPVLANAPVISPSPAEAPAAKPARRKPTLVAETPPMIPIVPIRTGPRPAGVAAGRMRGSDATLMANKPAKKAAEPQAIVPKAAVLKAAPKATVLKAAVPKPAAPKAAPKAAAPRRKAAATPTAAPAPAPAAKRPAKPRAKKAAAPPDSDKNPDLPA